MSSKSSLNFFKSKPIDDANDQHKETIKTDDDDDIDDDKRDKKRKRKKKKDSPEVHDHYCRRHRVFSQRQTKKNLKISNRKPKKKLANSKWQRNRVNM